MRICVPRRRRAMALGDKLAEHRLQFLTTMEFPLRGTAEFREPRFAPGCFALVMATGTFLA